MPRTNENFDNYEYLSRPKCPHCDSGMPYMDLSYLSEEDDDTTDMECDSCGKEYTVTTHVRFEYSSDYTEKQKQAVTEDGEAIYYDPNQLAIEFPNI